MRQDGMPIMVIGWILIIKDGRPKYRSKMKKMDEFLNKDGEQSYFPWPHSHIPESNTFLTITRYISQVPKSYMDSLKRWMLSKAEDYGDFNQISTV